MQTMQAGQLAAHAVDLAAARGGRVMIGIAGAPGCGKSSVAQSLVDELGARAALVPMDGFHLSQRMLDSLGRSARKGAPDTFDPDGLAALLARLRSSTSDVYVPTFDRAREEPVAAGAVVPGSSDIVIVEGNYLLLDREGWASIGPQLDATWYLQIDHDERMRRLIARHIEFGRSAEAAERWANEVDEPNARLIAASAARADLLVTG